MASPLNPQSIFPDVPRESPVVDKRGEFSPLWSLGIGQLFQALQENYKNEGILLPPINSAQAALIQSVYAPYVAGTLALDPGVPDISGQTIFNTDLRVPQQFIILYDASTPPKVISASWLNINVMTFNAGNPNGVVAGVLNWFCYDITNKVLYICTTSGTTISTVWTAV
jgi:hypothetical protein